VSEFSQEEIEYAFARSFTKKELTEIAKKHDLKGSSKLKKQELIDFLFENVDLETLSTYAEERIKRHRKLKAEIKGLSFEEQLAKLTDEKRLNNGLSIPDSEVQLIDEGKDSWNYRIKGYNCLVDMHRRIIRHDCTDWGFRCKRDHILCKHMIKVISKIDNAEDIVKSLNIDRWVYL
jgi:hypothetical protein